MNKTKENIKESINKLKIAESRLEDNPTKEDIAAAMNIIIDVFSTLDETKNWID